MGRFVSRGVMAACISIVAAGSLVASWSAAGPLDPPSGSISPTGKTLTEVEPRIVLSTANTPGDDDSTLKITQPGSYYLAGNLTASNAKRGIEIAASNVTLDLNGFQLVDTTGPEPFGIFASTAVRHVVIRNGGIRNFDQSAIDLTIGGDGSFSRIENVTVRGSSGAGIVTGPNSVVRGCVLANNGIGLIAGASSVVETCAVYQSNSDGVRVGDGSIVVECTLTQNGGVGIVGGSLVRVEGCAVLLSGSDGIRAGDGTIVRGCAVRESSGIGISVGARSDVRDCSVVLSGLDGISAAGSSVVRGNTSDSNGTSAAAVSAGIALSGSGTQASENHCTDNEVGVRVTGGGNILTANFSTSSTTSNWEVVAGNIALVVNGVNAGAITGSFGGVEPGSSNPAANVTY